jgi:hypothetical protein
MRLPIDTQAIQFAASGPAEPVIDFDTKAPRIDQTTGQPLFNVPLFAAGSGTADTLVVKVAGEPKGLGTFTPVRVTGLVAATWDMGDRHGVSFRAERIEATTAKPAS